MEQHSSLCEELKKTLDDPQYSPRDNPVVFEIPFTGTRYEVVVVWSRWKDVQPDERTDIINEAYRSSGRQLDIAQAMGSTYDEAIGDRLLPYAVHPHAREGEADFNELHKAMLEEGAIDLGEDKVDLRFPTKRMAETALERLQKNHPKGHWGLVLSFEEVLCVRDNVDWQLRKL